MKTIFFLLLFALSAAAQVQRTCRILYPGGPQQHAGKYYLFDGKNSQEVSLPRLSFSPVYKLSSGNIKLRMLAAPIASPEEVPAAAPELILLEDVTDIYLIISNDPSNKVLPLKMNLVNANHNKIGLGDMLWFNLTSKHIKGEVGRSHLSLAANDSALIKSPASAAGDYPVEIDFRVKGDERIHPLIESQWYHDPRSRYLVFVFDDGNRRAPRVMSFSDFRVPEPEGNH